MNTNKKPKINIRISVQEDKPFLKKWLMDPEVLQWFPMCNEREVDDAVNFVWVNYIKEQAVLTATDQTAPCGVCYLNLQPYEKLKHTCMITIIVEKSHRGKGVGTLMLKELERIAKEKFKIKILHLEVYEGNPAVHLYERLGFQKYGYQKQFVKQHNAYLGKTFMQKVL